MTTDVDFERRLRALYHAAADPSLVAGQLDRVMATTAVVPQRSSWWASLHRNDTGTHIRATVVSRRTAYVLVALLVTVAVAAFVASRPRLPSGRGVLAFVQDGDLLLADRDGRNPVVVLRGGGSTIQEPNWSPDGRRLLLGVGDDLVLLDIETLETRPVPAEPGARIAWSPDGARLAIAEGDREGCRSAYYRRYDQRCRDDRFRATLKIVDVANGQTRDLGRQSPIQRIAWSPDGRRLAAVVSGDLVVIDPSTGERQVVLAGDDGHGAESPVWSPDSTALAFDHLDCTTGRDGCSRSLGVVRLDGSGLLDLTPYGGWSSSPSWSPAGEWIAYEFDIRDLASADGRNSESLPGIGIVRADGSDRRVVHDTSVRHWAWDPDGVALSYTAPRAYGEQANAMWRYVVTSGETSLVGVDTEAFAWQPAQRRARPLALPAAAPVLGPTITLGAVASPAWAAASDPHDGVLAVGFDCELTLADFGAGTTRQIDGKADCESGTWQTQFSPDGRSFVYREVDGMKLLGPTGLVAVTEPSAGRNFVAWSPDGRWLVERACQDLRTTTCVSALVSADGATRRPTSEEPSWTPDGRRSWTWVAEDDGSGGPQEGTLSVGETDGSGMTSIGRFPEPVWAPNGDRFAYVHEGNVWLASADGRDARQVSSFELGGVDSIFWAPGGDRLAVIRGQALWIVVADGSASAQLDLPRMNVQSVRWSPDGTALAFGAYADDSPDLAGIYIVGLADRTAVLVRGADEPIWSPDGHHVAIQHTDESGQATVDIVNADGTGRHTVASGPMIVDKAWVDSP